MDERPRLSEAARYAAWRELWRHLLTLPDGTVPERGPEGEAEPEQDDERPSVRKRAAASGGRRPRSG